MDKLKRSFSFRKKKEHVPECSKPHQWQEDERKVRDGTCSFQVRYLGCIEVFESRGMKVCEEAVKVLKARSSRRVWARMSLRSKKKSREQQCKGKYQRAILYVSGDALRVVDEISKLKSTQGLIVDQTIEKVSFCAPDRHHEKGFAYISRDGTTRRWMCHGFLALKESGERLSHAVGCAFAICLEKKQKREKESVSVAYNDKGTTFTRTGSFRQTTMTERLADPQSAIIAEPVPETLRDMTHAVQRPHATDQMLQRQGSFRIFNKLQDTSPFKRQMSLRLNDLPSTLERYQELSEPGRGGLNGHVNGPGGVSPIPEASPTKENPDPESIANMCQQLSQGLSALSEDPFSAAPPPANTTSTPMKYQQPNVQQHYGQQQHTVQQHHNIQQQHAVQQHVQPQVHTNGQTNIPSVEPIRQNNPWSAPGSHPMMQSPQPQPPSPHTIMQSPPPTQQPTPQPMPHGTPQPRLSDAEYWLNSTTTSITSEPPEQHHMLNGHSMYASPPPSATMPQHMLHGHAGVQPPPAIHPALMPGPLTGGVPQQPHMNTTPMSRPQHSRSQSVDSNDSWWSGSQRAPTLRELANNGNVSQFHSQQNGAQSNGSWASLQSPPRPLPDADPFDAAWAAKAATQPGNKAFEVKL